LLALIVPPGGAVVVVGVDEEELQAVRSAAPAKPSAAIDAVRRLRFALIWVFFVTGFPLSVVVVGPGGYRLTGRAASLEATLPRASERTVNSN
jgi:hypothetical protein